MAAMIKTKTKSQLIYEIAQLRALLAEVVRRLKEIEDNLVKSLDKGRD